MFDTILIMEGNQTCHHKFNLIKIQMERNRADFRKYYNCNSTLFYGHAIGSDIVLLLLLYCDTVKLGKSGKEESERKDEMKLGVWLMQASQTSDQWHDVWWLVAHCPNSQQLILCKSLSFKFAALTSRCSLPCLDVAAFNPTMINATITSVNDILFYTWKLHFTISKADKTVTTDGQIFGIVS